MPLLEAERTPLIILHQIYSDSLNQAAEQILAHSPYVSIQPVMHEFQLKDQFPE